jgi:hypothetical protein
MKKYKPAHCLRLVLFGVSSYLSVLEPKTVHECFINEKKSCRKKENKD